MNASPCGANASFYLPGRRCGAARRPLDPRRRLFGAAAVVDPFYSNSKGAAVRAANGKRQPAGVGSVGRSLRRSAGLVAGSQVACCGRRRAECASSNARRAGNNSELNPTACQAPKSRTDRARTAHRQHVRKQSTHQSRPHRARWRPCPCSSARTPTKVSFGSSTVHSAAIAPKLHLVRPTHVFLIVHRSAACFERCTLRP